jgi:hypothetical protein
MVRRIAAQMQQDKDSDWRVEGWGIWVVMMKRRGR